MKMLRLLLVMIILCGVLYPLSVTWIAQLGFSTEAEGHLIHEHGKLVGSKLLAQKFSRADYFHSRPSAADFATVASGASQAAPTQKVIREAWEKRRLELPEAGEDAWTASGSGLDPHISPKTAYAQAPRIAAARGLKIEGLNSLIDQHTESPTWGIWGRPRVNVLELNLALLRTEGSDAHTR